MLRFDAYRVFPEKNAVFVPLPPGLCIGVRACFGYGCAGRQRPRVRSFRDVKDRAVRRDQAAGKDLPVPGAPKRMASALARFFKYLSASLAVTQEGAAFGHRQSGPLGLNAL